LSEEKNYMNPFSLGFQNPQDPAQEGIKFINLAVAEDRNHNIPEAVKNYELAIYFLTLAYQRGDNEKFGGLLPSKIKEYTERCNMLKNQINLSATNSGLIPNTVPNASNSNNTSPFVPVQNHNSNPTPSFFSQNDKPQQLIASPINFDIELNSRLLSSTATASGARSGDEDLQKALDIVERAKEEDKQKNYLRAFELYMQALDYFVLAAKRETSEHLKVSLNKTIKVYIDRAEALKQYLEKTQQLSPSKPSVQSQIDLQSSVLMKQTNTTSTSKLKPYCPSPGVDLRIGPLTKQNSTTFWNDSNPLLLAVTIDKNIIRPNEFVAIDIIVDNKSSIKVAKLLIYLQQTETVSNVDVQGRRSTKSTITNLNRVVWNGEGAFPLVKRVFQGRIVYSIPENIPLTDSDFSTCFAREYQLIVHCDIPKHNDLLVNFPIQIRN